MIYDIDFKVNTRGGLVMETLYIVMPAYNEEDNIVSVINQWYPILKGKSEQSKLVVADFGSKDKTHEILLDMKENGYPQLELLNNKNQFHGPKVLDLYKYAISKGDVDYIFQTDSDGQTNPEEFSSFWNDRKEYDVILGNRVARGDGKDRALVEKVVCLLLKLYFGVNVKDANAPFRLMKTSVVEKYVNKLPEDYNIPNIMMTAYFSYFGEKIDFREISFKPRTAGVNSVNIPRIIKIGWKALGDFRKLKKEIDIQ